jgi:secreted trypsin-like serine protease
MIAALFAGAVGCAAPAAETQESANAEGDLSSTHQAITRGEDDDSDSAIVALLVHGKVFCTGVLVTPTVVVTAAHCVLPSPPDQVFFGSNPRAKEGTFIGVTDTHAHPDFDEDTLENDIALVGLAMKGPATPLSVVSKPLDDASVGRTIRVVGFGATSPEATADLRKRTGTTSIESFTSDDFRFRPSPAGTCVGDSGGPALVTVGDHEAVIGITSSGDSECKTYGRDIRMDRYVSFIHGYAKAYSLPTGPDENKGCSISGAPRRTGASSAALLLGVACALVGLRRRARA